MIISQPNLDALRLSFSQAFQSAYDSTPVYYSQLCSTIPSSTLSARYGWIAQQVAMREWSGARQALNLVERTQTITNRKFEVTIQVPRDQIEDDNLGMYAGGIFPQLGQAAKKWPDRLLLDVLAANPTTFDGVSLFNDSHPNFNVTGAGATTYDNSHALALDAANFNTVRATMAKILGEDGRPLGVMPRLLIVGPALERTAREIVNASLVAGASGGYTNVMQGWADVLVIPELTSDTQWYLADVSKSIKPFALQVRRAPEFASRDNLSDPQVFEQEVFTYGASARGELFATLPFLIARGNT